MKQQATQALTDEGRNSTAGERLGWSAPACTNGTYPELDKLLAFDIGGDQHLVNHAALALPQAAAHITLGEALCLPRGFIRQGGCLANDHILT